MRYPLMLLTLAALVSFLGCTKKDRVVVRLDNVRITEDEVLTAYRSSPYFIAGSGGMKAFLDQYISKKMILLEAERKGLDKGPEFLSEIQQYWEQELLKLTLARVNSGLPPVVVSDGDIQDFFIRQRALFPGKDFSEVRDEIKDYLAKERQKQALQRWLEDVKQRTRVEVDYAALGVE